MVPDIDVPYKFMLASCRALGSKITSKVGAAAAMHAGQSREYSRCRITTKKWMVAWHIKFVELRFLHLEVLFHL